MLTELQRDRVWEAWFESDVRSYYFAALAARFHRRQQIITWTSLVLSSGALVTIISKLPTDSAWVGPALAFVAAALSVYSLIAQNQTKQTDAAALHKGWNKLATEFRRLWDHMYDDDAEEQLERLDAQAAELSADGLTLPYDEADMKKWGEFVRQRFMALRAA